MKYFFPLSTTNQQRQFEKMVWVYPAHIAMYATYLRDQGHDVYWGEEHIPREQIMNGHWDKIVKNDFQIDVNFENLPFPDRKFTDALNPRWQDYGNYKHKPATHMMASNLCWYGKCTFCIDTVKLQKGEGRGVRSVEHVLAEIDDLIAQGYKEVFDDSGSFPVGEWLTEFCSQMISSGRNKKIVIGCNMKPVRLNYEMMREAGFRFILVGLESANQKTLDKLKKGQNAKEMVEFVKSMANAGLEVHSTWMTGFPWETEEDEKRTIELCHFLLRKGYSKTAQASVYSEPRTAPDPGSPGHKYLPRFYDVYKSPEFIWRKIIEIRCWQDFTYLVRGARLVIEEKWRKLVQLHSPNHRC